MTDKTLFSDAEARMRDAQFCLLPLRPFAGMREYDEVLRRIVELLTPVVDRELKVQELRLRWEGEAAPGSGRSGRGRPGRS